MGLLALFLRLWTFLLTPFYVYPPKSGKDTEPKDKEKKTGSPEPLTEPPTTSTSGVHTSTVALTTSAADTDSRSTSYAGAIKRTAPQSLGIPAAPADPSPTETDPRVGWIYRLHRDQLVNELENFGLSSEGTVVELRKRLVTYIRAQGSIQPTTVPSQRLEVDNKLDYAGLPDYQQGGNSHAFHNVGIKQPYFASEQEDRSGQTRHPNLDKIKEMLGLNPMTTDEQMQFVLSQLLQSSRITASSKTAVPPEIALRVTDQQPITNQTVGEGNDRQNTNELAHTCNIVRKWNLKFDGGKDAISFLERLDELVAAYGIKQELLLRSMPELLKGQALLWYRNNKDFWAHYDDFLSDFKIQFLPPEYERNLTQEIDNRTQGETESFRNYVTALCTLMRRKGGYSAEEQMDKIYTNMRPDYKLTIHRCQFTSVGSAIKLAEHYESYLREKQNYRPPPNPAQSLMPETAYYRSNDRTRTSVGFDNSTPRREQHQNTHRNWNTQGQDKSSRFTNRTFQSSMNTRRIGERRATPASASPDDGSRNATPSNLSSFSQPSEATSKLFCWNCEKNGHKFHECNEPRVIRCFNCKKEGVRTIHCECKKGNANWVRREGGTPALGKPGPSTSLPHNQQQMKEK